VTYAPTELVFRKSLPSLRGTGRRECGGFLCVERNVVIAAKVVQRPARDDRELHLPIGEDRCRGGDRPVATADGDASRTGVDELTQPAGNLIRLELFERESRVVAQSLENLAGASPTRVDERGDRGGCRGVRWAGHAASTMEAPCRGADRPNPRRARR